VTQFFQKNTNSANKKCWEKIASEKCAKNVFYIHTKVVTKKIGEKKARNNFSRNTRIVRSKNVGKKIVGKSAKKRFIYSHENHHQKMGPKNTRNIFTEAHE